MAIELNAEATKNQETTKVKKRELPTGLGRGTIAACSVYCSLATILMAAAAILEAIIGQTLAAISIAAYTIILLGCSILAIWIADKTMKGLADVARSQKKAMAAEEILQETKLISRCFLIFMFSGLILGSILVSRLRRTVLNTWEEKTARKVVRTTTLGGFGLLAFVVIFSILSLPMKMAVQEAVESIGSEESTRVSEMPTWYSTQTNAEELVAEFKTQYQLPTQVDEETVLEDITTYKNIVIFQYAIDLEGGYLDTQIIREIMIAQCCAKENRELLSATDGYVWSYRDVSSGETYEASISLADCLNDSSSF